MTKLKMASKNDPCCSRKRDSIQDGIPMEKKAKPDYRWNMKLYSAMQDPKLIVDDSDELVVVIKDLYPKAKHHYLVIPKANKPNLKDLGAEDVKLLKHMKDVGESLIAKVQREKKDEGPKQVKFRMGYHAVPSMQQVHMHVISQDFDAPRLKNKKHWNSFTSAFFLEVDWVIGELESKGCIRIDKARYEAMLKEPLKCHVCSAAQTNMPRLKAHIKQH